MVTKVPRGTPLAECGAAGDESPALSVLSYNLLAPMYVRPIDERTGAVQAFAAFEWASEEVLDWKSRQPRLLAELQASNADIICCQEVQFDADADGASFSLPGWLRLDGYAAVLPAQASLAEMSARNARVLRNSSPVGNALLYRSIRLRPCTLQVANGKTSENSTTRVAAALEGVPGTGLKSLGPTVAVSVHLDATDEAQRVKQLSNCLRVVSALGLRELVVAGDMNTEILPGSCIAALLADAADPTPEELAAECASAHRLSPAELLAEKHQPLLLKWADLQAQAAAAPEEHRVRLSRVPTGPTRAAWEHDQPGMFRSWRLDHILYTGRTLQVRLTQSITALRLPF